MTETKIYHYHPETKEFMGQSIARLDPLGGHPLIPAYSTIQAPIESGDGMSMIFDGEQWQSLPDYRGKRYYNEDYQEITIKELGKIPADDWVELAEGEAMPLAPLLDEEILSGIKREAARRIEACGHDWMALRQVTSGIEVPADIVQYAELIRQTSGELEQRSPLPQDYINDRHWPSKL